MKNLTGVVCLDDRGGLAFNNRRQSRDRLLIKNLCEGCEGKIYIDAYSLPLFSEYAERVKVLENPIADCPDGAVYFFEREAPRQLLSECKTLIVYRWNRTYPYDVAFDLSMLDTFDLKEEYEFVGSSHEKITKGIYER